MSAWRKSCRGMWCVSSGEEHEADRYKPGEGKGEGQMNKTEMKQNLSEALAVLQVNDLASISLADRMAAMQEEVENFKARILMVGQFSAGKTALLNAMLGGEEILKEDINPETALATELVYGSTASIIRVHKDGREEAVTREEMEKQGADDSLKYVYALDNEALRELSDVILVDMPGFDSGIKAHNDAILQYRGEAAAYIFVFDVTKGALSEAALDFLMELRGFSDTIRFVLTKCDKFTSESNEEVAAEFCRTVESALGIAPEVEKTSARDPEAREVMLRLVQSLPADELMTKKLKDRAILLVQNGIDVLEAQLETLDFNPHEIDRAIQERAAKKEAFERDLAGKRQELHTRMMTKSIPQILGDVENALRSNGETLVDAILTGSSQEFSRRANDILRNVLSDSMQRNVDKGFEEIFISLPMLAEGEKNFGEGMGAMDMKETIKSIDSMGRKGLAMLDKRKYSGLHSVLSVGLSLTTKSILPVVGAVLMFLPDLVSLVGRLFGKSKEEQARESLERRIIPEVCRKLRPAIEKSVTESEAEVTAALEREYHAMIDNEMEALGKLQEEKKAKAVDAEAKKKKMQQGMATLADIRQRLIEA